MRKTKNIAILINTIQGGGAERVASVLSHYFTEKGYQVYFFVSQYNRKKAFTVSGKVITLKAKQNEAKGFGKNFSIFCSLLNMSSEVRKLKKKYKIDTAISFMEDFNIINVLSKGKEKIILRVCTILSERDEYKKLVYYNKFLIRLLYNRADKIVVMTKYAVQDLVTNWKIDEKLLQVIANPLNDRLEFNGKQLQWEYGEHTILSVNRLDSVKQLWHLVRAFKKVVQQVTDAELLFLGGGENYTYLNQLVSALELKEKVHFLGFQKEVIPILERGKIFVMTSKTEGFPNSMLEALSTGTCVISADCPGAPREILAPATKYTGKLRDVEYAEYGILVPAFSGKRSKAKEPLSLAEEKLAEAITTAVLDDSIIKRYKIAGKQRASAYLMEDIGKVWEDMICKG